MRQALAAGDVGRVAAVAHKLKGSSGVVGASRVAALAAALQEAGAVVDPGAASVLIDALAAALRETRDAYVALGVRW